MSVIWLLRGTFADLCEVEGYSGRFADCLRLVDVSQIVNRHAEAFDNGAGKLKVNVFVGDAGDTEDGCGAAYADSLADGYLFSLPYCTGFGMSQRGPVLFA
jgi:hypothetical protein